jgi:hypothetical protein
MKEYEEEIWKPITTIALKNGQVHNFDGYEVSNYGRVRTYLQRYGQVSRSNILTGISRPKMLKPVLLNGRPDSKGYLQYWLRDNNKVAKNFRAHVLVMQTFIGFPKEYEVVCHNDDVKTNNHISNLRYDTQLENMLDKKRNSQK